MKNFFKKLFGSSIFKTVAHAALGGALAGAGGAYNGGAITSKSVLLPALGGAVAAVYSLFAKPPGSSK